MYSVVLLMAITAGGESADGCRGCRGCGCYSTCGYRGCRACRGCGCYGCYSCGCYGGCTVSYGCYSGCTVSHGCAVYHGCHSGCVVYHGCTATCGAVVIGCTACHGCSVPKIIEGKKIEDKKKAELDKPTATIVVSLPADAKVTIDGNAAAVSASTTRTFESPALEAGKTYGYTFAAEYVRDGQTMKVSKQVTFQAGGTVSLDLTTGGAAVARR